jgi:pyruvate dehydrogenase E2 component (dihydrolipoamide acetyltransferase)
MGIDVKLPSLGENIDSGDVLSVLVSEGDEVSADQGIIEIETDKATVEVPAPQAGRVSKVHVSEGQTLKIGSIILTLDAAGAKSAPEKPAAPAPAKAEASAKKEAPAEEEPAEEEEAPVAKKPAAKPAKAAAPAPAKSKPAPKKPAPAPVAEEEEEEEDEAEGAEEESTADGHGAAAGPAIRRLARELGVDLRRVRATGPGGRISREDVQGFVRESNQRAATVQRSTSTGPTPPGDLSVNEYGSVRRERMSRMRQTIARNMTLSYTTIPQLTNFDDADVTDLERIRQESKDDYAESGIKLTTMPFLIKAIASALKHHPVINASIDLETNEIIYKEYVNIGIAVDTDRGLLVPVLRNVDQMNIPQIAHALADLSDSARKGDYTIDDLRGGTFTISNLGAIGGTYSTPIINPPEVAILLAGRTRKMPVYVGETVQPRLMLPLSISYDHRVVDGAAAARFLNEVKGYLSAPGRLLLAP